MTELALLLLLAAIGHGLSRWTGLPVIPLLIGLGMAFSFSGLAAHPGAEGGVEDDPLFFVLELGLTVLVFASGVELNPQRFRRQRRAVLWVGLLQFTVMGVVGWAGALALGFAGMPAVYLAFAVSASSTIVVLRQLQVSQQSFEPHGRMVVGVLLLQDALTIVTLVALTHLGAGVAPLALGLLYAALMAAAAWLLQWRGARWLIERCRSDEEAMLLVVLSVLFVFLGASGLAGLPLVVGAFLAGYGLSSFPVSGLVGGLLQSLADFFRAIFFVALGALVVVPQPGAVGVAAVLALLVLVITPPLVAAVAEWMGLTSRSAIESGLLLAQTSEYSLVLGLVGLRFGHIDAEVFAIVAMMAVATMTCTPLLARESVARRLMRLHPLRRRRRLPALECREHVLVLGLGSAGMWVLKPLQSAGVPILVVDDDPIVIAELDKKGVPCLRGDGADEHTLERIGARHARLIIASMRRVSDAQKVLAHAKGVPVLARVFEDHEAEAIRRLGGIPVSNSEAAVEQFMKWFQAGQKTAA
ncbi:MAG TPA: cation:proton antiporter [Prosthecobacter sp.]|nr:cation:proton antiporter [Prosthecobacter sp.]HRK15620.1 cation:proton antiporter [Prosthecobacter sp.]